MQKTTTVKLNRDPMMQERSMIEAAKKDPSQFRLLYTKYHEAIFRYVYQRVHNVDDAKDVVSQVFLKALQNIGKYEFQGYPFSAWLYRIALSESTNLFRKSKVKRTVNIDEVTLPSLLNELEEDDRSEAKEKMIEVLRELPEQDLQLVEMRYFEQRRFAEIGEILEITENNAKVRLYRILERMKKLIKANN